MSAVPRPTTKQRLLESLARLDPAPAVFADDEDLKPFETDGFIVRRATPLLAVLPESEAQAGAVVRLCRAAGVPVVTRGAGTGVSGGAIPREDGVLLVVSKMRRVLEVDPLARQAVVEPGVRNVQVSEAAAPAGLFYAPDPSSQSVCSIGGNVAENSGGVHCLKYGFTTHNVAAVRGFDGEGELLEVGSRALDGPGYDLIALVTGSEGNLMVITRVTVAWDSRAARKRCCSPRSMAAAPRSMTPSRAHARSSSAAGRPRSAWRRTKPSARACGARARAPSPRSPPSTPTTTRSTAPSRAAAFPRCSTA